MVSKRLSTFMLIVGSLWLSGCATPSGKITANNLVSSASQDAAKKIGDASPGDVVELPAGNIFGEATVVVGDDYTAASGRLCRRLRSGRVDVDTEQGSELTRIACQRESGEWYSPRALTTNNQESASQARKASTQSVTPIAIAEPLAKPLDSDSVDTRSVVVVELGDADLQTSTDSVRSNSSAMETEKHLLNDGETLWSFSRRITGNALNWNAIAELNDIDDSRRLSAGDSLLVPKLLVRGEH